MTVKILDAGGKLMLSGDIQAEVDAELAKQIGLGAKPIGPTHQIGSSWVASCTLPARGKNPDTTTTLRISELAPDAHSGMEPEFDDGCQVDEFGFKRIVTGPTRTAVEQRLEHMKRFGAELVGAIEEQDGAWVAVVDTGGADKHFKF